VTLRRTKNGKPRTLASPLLDELAAVRAEQRALVKLFDWKARGGVDGPLRGACKRAGVDYLPRTLMVRLLRGEDE
jgi:hypothetical protein